MEVLETKRLLFRAFTIEDAEDLFEYAVDPRVGPSAGWLAHQTIEDSKRIIEQFNTTNETYAIVLKSENKVIGSFGIHQRIPDETLSHLNQRIFGFVLNPKYWGNGYIPEAVEFFLDYGFNTMNLDLIWCGHFDFNENSKRVILKTGFNYQFTVVHRLPKLNNQEVTILNYNIYKENYLKTKN